MTMDFSISRPDSSFPPSLPSPTSTSTSTLKCLTSTSTSTSTYKPSSIALRAHQLQLQSQSLSLSSSNSKPKKTHRIKPKPWIYQPKHKPRDEICWRMTSLASPPGMLENMALTLPSKLVRSQVRGGRCASLGERVALLDGDLGGGGGGGELGVGKREKKGGNGVDLREIELEFVRQAVRDLGKDLLKTRQACTPTPWIQAGPGRVNAVIKKSVFKSTFSVLDDAKNNDTVKPIDPPTHVLVVQLPPDREEGWEFYAVHGTILGAFWPNLAHVQPGDNEVGVYRRVVGPRRAVASASDSTGTTTGNGNGNGMATTGNGTGIETEEEEEEEEAGYTTSLPLIILEGLPYPTLLEPVLEYFYHFSERNLFYALLPPVSPPSSSSHSHSSSHSTTTTTNTTTNTFDTYPLPANAKHALSLSLAQQHTTLDLSNSAIAIDWFAQNVNHLGVRDGDDLGAGVGGRGYESGGDGEEKREDSEEDGDELGIIDENDEDEGVGGGGRGGGGIWQVMDDAWEVMIGAIGLSLRGVCPRPGADVDVDV